MTSDFTLFDIHPLLDYIGFSDRVEHEGYFAELERMDFSQEEQARAAIRKWLLPAFANGIGRTESGRMRAMTAFRVALSRWGFVASGPDLPGIFQSSPPYRPQADTLRMLRNFYSWVWDELFHEPFVPIAGTDALLERIDATFAGTPHSPSPWGTPAYRPLTYWDDLIPEKDWRIF